MDELETFDTTTCITSTISTPTTTAQCYMVMSNSNPNTSISSNMLERNSITTLLCIPAASTMSGTTRTFVDSNREQYEREREDLSILRTVVDLTERNFLDIGRVLARRLVDSDDDGEVENYVLDNRSVDISETDLMLDPDADVGEEEEHESPLCLRTRISNSNNNNIDSFASEIVDDDDNDNEDDYEEEEREHVDDDQEKNTCERLHETDDSENDDDDDDHDDEDDEDEDETTTESELSINLGFERQPSHHTNDDDGSTNDNESHENYEHDGGSSNPPENEREDYNRQNGNNAGALNDEIDDDDDLDVETTLEAPSNLFILVAHAHRLDTADENVDEEFHVDRYITLNHYRPCGHFHRCNCAAMQTEPSIDSDDVANNSNVDLDSIWNERSSSPVEAEEKHALDEIETESKQTSSAGKSSPIQFDDTQMLNLMNSTESFQIEEEALQEEEEENTEGSFVNIERTLSNCVADGPENDPIHTNNVENKLEDTACAINISVEQQVEEWTTEEEEEVQPDVLECSNLSAVKWPGVKLPLNVTLARYNAFLKRLSSSHVAKCDHQQLTLNFMQTLVLPRIYMDTQMPAVCFCQKCYGRDSARMRGWVYFKLNTSIANKRAETSVAQLESCNGEWLPLYYITGVDNVRRILDLGRLLPHDVYKRKEYSTYDPDMGSKEEPSRRVELHISPNAKTVQTSNSKLKLLVLDGKKYRLYTAFEVYVRRQALRRIKQASTDLDDSQQSDMPTKHINLENLFPQNSALNGRPQLPYYMQPEEAETQTTQVNTDLNDLAANREKETSHVINLLMDSDDEMDISAELSPTNSVSQESAGQTQNTAKNRHVLNAAAIAMAAVQGPRLKERIWFTKEAGACIITGLMFKLESKATAEQNNQNDKCLVTANVKEVKTTTAVRHLPNSKRSVRYLHFNNFWWHNRRSRKRKHRSRMLSKKNMAKPIIPAEE